MPFGHQGRPSIVGPKGRWGLTQTVEADGMSRGGDEMGISNRLGDVLGSAVESKLLREVKQHPEKVNHLAIIMDGNSRWAQKKDLSKEKGHKACLLYTSPSPRD